MHSMIHVGPVAATTKATADAILAIINTPTADAVKLAALEAMSDILRVENVAITNNVLKSSECAPVSSLF